jgi:hypothetical protein
MENVFRMTDSEKKLFTVLGRYPDISMKDLLIHTTYKRMSSIMRKLDQFRDQEILYGPVYEIEYGRLCRNPFHRVMCVMETTLSYETVISYLALIEPLGWIFPVLSPNKTLLNVASFSSNDAEMIEIFRLLKDYSIITDYLIRISSLNRVIENPDFFGDFNPPLDTLLDYSDIPDISYGCHDTYWNTCDISILPYLRMGYKGAKLIEILRAERKLQRNWTYSQIKYSREKMVTKGLIKKEYGIYPFPYNQCVHFILYVKCEDVILPRILHNFARGARVYKEYLNCGDWGLMECVSHHLFLTDLMNKLDSIEEIKEKEVYHIRSIPEKYWVSEPPLLKHFDFDNQTVEYPYHVYREKVKVKLENEFNL